MYCSREQEGRWNKKKREGYRTFSWQNKICDKELRGIIIKFYNAVNFATEKKYRGGSSQERGIKWRVNGLGNGMFIPPHTFDNFHFKPRNF